MLQPVSSNRMGVFVLHWNFIYGHRNSNYIWFSHITKRHYFSDFFPTQCMLCLGAVQKQVSELLSARSCPRTEIPPGRGISPVLITPSQCLAGSDAVFIQHFDILLIMECFCINFEFLNYSIIILSWWIPFWCPLKFTSSWCSSPCPTGRVPWWWCELIQVGRGAVEDCGLQLALSPEAGRCQGRFQRLRELSCGKNSAALSLTEI